MTENKDFKRLVRARMKKTGESYTTARAHLLAKGTQPPEGALDPADYADLAGMSDEAVEAKTERDWEGWVEALDRAGASDWSHRDIAAFVGERYDLTGWWAQTVTVGYERIKGLRAVGQRRDGSYEANKSKTVQVPVGELYRAFEDPERRQRWLPDVQFEVRTATRDKSMRITWEDGTSLEIYFTAKETEKSQVTVQHVGLPSERDREEAKSYWSERLAALAELLEP